MIRHVARVLSAFAALFMLGAVATADTPDQQGQAPAPEPSVVELLVDLGHDATAAELQLAAAGSTETAQSFPFPFPGSGQCDGYQPDPGCYIVQNDGEWCTERCAPDTQILRICDCVQ